MTLFIKRRLKLYVFLWIFLVFVNCAFCRAVKSSSKNEKKTVADKMQNKLVETAEMTLEEDTKESRIANRKNTNNNQPSLVEKMLPMMVTPFLVSTAMIPLMLMSLKFMLIKAALIGKIGIILLLINFLRRRATGGGVFSHNVNYKREDEVAYEHYGYQGHEEYGNYVNRKRRKRYAWNI